jgi:hypothetical protein
LGTNKGLKRFGIVIALFCGVGWPGYALWGLKTQDSAAVSKTHFTSAENIRIATDAVLDAIGALPGKKGTGM